MRGLIFIFFTSILIGLLTYAIFYHFQPIQQSTTPAITPTLAEPYQYTPEIAPTNTLRGDISSIEGDVSWVSRIATEPASLSAGIQIQQGEQIVTAVESEVSIDFEDDVNITLSENTRLAITQTLPASIVLTQRYGNVRYTVSSSKYPISVRIRRLLVRMYEGEVDISVEEDDPVISVDVSEGAAEVAYNDSDFTSQRLMIEDGEVFTFNNDERIGTIE